MTPTLEVFENEEELARASMERFIALARQAIALRSRFNVALCGGATPERLYRLLADPENVTRVPWPRTFVYFGDERFVPEDNPSSNCGAAQRLLLDHVPLPPAQRFAVPTQLESPTAAAAAYEQTLKERLGELPIFDLILLGLGADGHTASLFPGQTTLTEKQALVVAAQPGELPPPLPRITLTFPIINAARNILVIVSGEKKRTMLATWLSGEGALSSLPAVGIAPTSGAATIYADRAAAGERRSA